MIKKWNDKLEKMFETNTQDLTLIESQRTFELNSDNRSLENLSYIHSMVSKKDISFVFSQLAPFFEVGFLFEKQKQNYAAIQGFAFSHMLELAE